MIGVSFRKWGVMSKLIIENKDYKNWIQDVSTRFKRSQIKAATRVNSEMLMFYWSLGKDISDKIKSATYGSSFYLNVSADLRKLLPDVKSFSVTNLKYMQYFYELYSIANHPQVGDDFGNDIIFQIPWGHHKQIIDKCKGNRDKALFFVRETLENGWSRAVLLNWN